MSTKPPVAPLTDIEPEYRSPGVGYEGEATGVEYAAGWNDCCSEVRRRLSEARPAPDLTRALDDLKVAAEQFRNYESLHRAKGTSDGAMKAGVNQIMAERLEQTIAALSGHST